MVKGVNKKIIEINNTENEFFEKIVLYVSPKASAVNSAKIKKAVDDVAKKLSTSSFENKSLREILNAKKRKKKIALILCAVFAFLSGVLLLILL